MAFGPTIAPGCGSRSGLSRRNGPSAICRQDRGIAWIEEALNPLGDERSEAAIRQLTLAIRSAVGVEALCWLTDVANLRREDAAALMAWSAQAFLQAARAGSPPPEMGPSAG